MNLYYVLLLFVSFIFLHSCVPAKYYVASNISVISRNIVRRSPSLLTNPCEKENVCQNYGGCVNLDGENIFCTCEPSFHGENCEEEIEDSMRRMKITKNPFIFETVDLASGRFVLYLVMVDDLGDDFKAYLEGSDLDGPAELNFADSAQIISYVFTEQCKDTHWRLYDFCETLLSNKKFNNLPRRKFVVDKYQYTGNKTFPLVVKMLNREVEQFAGMYFVQPPLLIPSTTQAPSTTEDHPTLDFRPPNVHPIPDEGRSTTPKASDNDTWTMARVEEFVNGDLDSALGSKDQPQAVQMIVAAADGMAQVSSDGADGNVTSRKSDVKRKFVDALGRMNLSTPAAREQVSGALDKVLQVDSKAVDHASAAAASDLINTISGLMLDSNNTEEELDQITSNILGSVSALLVGDLEVTKDGDIAGLPDDVDEHVYDSLDTGNVRKVTDYNHASGNILKIVGELARCQAQLLRESLGEKSINTKNLVMWVKVDRPTSLAGKLLGGTANESGIEISPMLARVLEESSPVIFLQITTMKKDPFWFKHKIIDMNTEFILVAIEKYGPNMCRKSNGTNKVKTFSTPLNVYFKADTNNVSETVKGTTTVVIPENLMDLDYQIVVYQIEMDKGSVLCLKINSEKTITPLNVVVTQDVRPSWSDFENALTIPPNDMNGELDYVIKHPEIAEKDAVLFYVGILPHKSLLNGSGGEIQLSYDFNIFKAKCCYWDAAGDQWSTDGCEVGDATNTSTLHCRCTHLSFLAGSYIVTHNMLRAFDGVEIISTHTDENVLIVCVAMVTVFLYILCLIWARRKDRRDIEERGVTVLEDNECDKHYPYMITIFTGHQWNAGTTSNVGIQLIGKIITSDAHILIDRTRKVLHARSDSWFLMCVRESLGDLKFIRIWSDFSGPRPCWYCDKVLVREIKTGKLYTFQVRRWFSVLKGDGSLYCTQVPTENEEVSNNMHRISDNLKLGFQEDHMWLRIFWRHPRSSFTRCQRLSLAICSFILVMLFQMLLYGIPTEELNSQLDPGTYIVSTKGFEYALISLILTFPIICFISLLFRRSNCSARSIDDANTRGASTNYYENSQNIQEEDEEQNAKQSKDKYPDRSLNKEVQSGETKVAFIPRFIINVLMKDPLTPAEETAIKSQRETFQFDGCNCRGRCKCPYFCIQSKKQSGKANIQIQASDRYSENTKFPPGPSYWFPHWVINIAWIACIMTMLISVYLLSRYSITFSKVKGFLWLTSVCWALVVSVLIAEPLKVFFIAFIIGFLYRKGAKTVYYPHNIYGNISCSKFVVLRYFKERMKNRRKRQKCQPLQPSQQEARKQRSLNRDKLVDMLIDLILFITYYAALYMIVWGNQDSLAYRNKSNIENMITRNWFETAGNFSSIQNMNDYIKYVNNSLLPGLHGTEFYNNKPVEGIGWTSDFSTQLLGIPRLRQLRVRSKLCVVYAAFQTLIKECFATYNLLNAETKDYNLGWSNDWSNYDDQVEKAREPWLYQPSQSTNSSTFRGAFANYPGSGYIATLGRTREHSRTVLNFLVTFGWFDQYTRAIFIDFTTYSTNQNLFSVVTLAAERSHSGAWSFYEQIRTVKLLVMKSEINMYEAVAIVLCSTILFLHICRQLFRLLYKSSRNYLANVWNVIDIFIGALCVASIVIYFLRGKYVSNLVRQLETLEQKNYISFVTAAYWDSVLGYVMAILISLSTVRLWKLLRLFGKKFIMFERTIIYASATLFSLLLTVVIALATFVTALHLLLGSFMESFRNISHSTSSLICYAFGFGGIDVNSFVRAHQVFGPALHAAFSLVVSIYILNMFNIVIRCFYDVSRRFRRDEVLMYGPLKYLLDELRYLVGLDKPEMKNERLRGGADLTKQSVATPKETTAKREYNNKIMHSKLETMRLLTLDFLQAWDIDELINSGKLVKSHRAMNALSKERLEAQLIIVLDALQVFEAGKGNKAQLFFIGKINKSKRLVSQMRLFQIEHILNNYAQRDQNHSSKNDEEYDEENTSWIGEECEILSTKLNRLAILLENIEWKNADITHNFCDNVENVILSDIDRPLVCTENHYEEKTISSNTSQAHISSEISHEFVPINNSQSKPKATLNVRPQLRRSSITKINFASYGQYNNYCGIYPTDNDSGDQGRINQPSELHCSCSCCGSNHLNEVNSSHFPREQTQGGFHPTTVYTPHTANYQYNYCGIYARNSDLIDSNRFQDTKPSHILRPCGCCEHQCHAESERNRVCATRAQHRCASATHRDYDQQGVFHINEESVYPNSRHLNNPTDVECFSVPGVETHSIATSDRLSYSRERNHARPISSGREYSSNRDNDRGIASEVLHDEGSACACVGKGKVNNNTPRTQIGFHHNHPHGVPQSSCSNLPHVFNEGCAKIANKNQTHHHQTRGDYDETSPHRYNNHEECYRRRSNQEERSYTNTEPLKRWESSANFEPMRYVGRDCASQNTEATSSKEEIENLINNIGGFTFTLNMSGAEVVFRGLRTDLTQPEQYSTRRDTTRPEVETFLKPNMESEEMCSNENKHFKKCNVSGRKIQNRKRKYIHSYRNNPGTKIKKRNPSNLNFTQLPSKITQAPNHTEHVRQSSFKEQEVYTDISVQNAKTGSTNPLHIATTGNNKELKRVDFTSTNLVLDRKKDWCYISSPETLSESDQLPNASSSKLEKHSKEWNSFQRTEIVQAQHRNASLHPSDFSPLVSESEMNRSFQTARLHSGNDLQHSDDHTYNALQPVNITDRSLSSQTEVASTSGLTPRQTNFISSYEIIQPYKIRDTEDNANLPDKVVYEDCKHDHNLSHLSMDKCSSDIEPGDNASKPPRRVHASYDLHYDLPGFAVDPCRVDNVSRESVFKSDEVTRESNPAPAGASSDIRDVKGYPTCEMSSELAPVVLKQGPTEQN